jgi:hypothetical protein
MNRFMWIFVEGESDRRFANAVLLPILRKRYDYIDTWEYAQKPPEKTAEFLRAMKSKLRG